MVDVPTVSWDETEPQNTDDAGQGDDEIRRSRTQVREVIDVDHQFNSSGKDPENGYHTILHMLQQTLPALIEDIGQLYTRDLSDGVTELFYLDEAGNETQITNLGTVSGTGPKQGNQGDDFVANAANGHGLAYNTVVGEITDTGTGENVFSTVTDIECEITAIENDILEVTLQGVFQGDTDNKYIKARPISTDGDVLKLIGTSTIAGVVNDDMTDPGETIVAIQLYRVNASGVIKFAMEWGGKNGLAMKCTDRVLIAKVL